MDTLTHAISGAVAGRALPDRRGAPGPGLRERTWAGFVAAAFPDIDIVLRFLDPLVYLNLHRGVTHSLLLLPVWAWLLALVFARVAPWFGGGRYGWRAWYLVSAVALLIHIIGDLITSYGTQLLAPCPATGSPGTPPSSLTPGSPACCWRGCYCRSTGGRSPWPASPCWRLRHWLPSRR